MKKIAVTGPESTGKSSLTKALAAHFETVWVPEFARDFLNSKPKGFRYSFEDISFIAEMQMKSEDALSANRDLIFCDTEMLVCKIWQEFVYGASDPIVEAAFQNRHYDLFLLCNIDLEWEFDPLREHPQDREKLFELYKNALEKSGKPYALISGTGNDRLQSALEAVNKVLYKT